MDKDTKNEVPLEFLDSEIFGEFDEMQSELVCKHDALDIVLIENANEIELVSIDFLFFQLDTFLANGGLLKIKMDGDAQIFDINVLPMKLYNGKSI